MNEKAVPAEEPVTDDELEMTAGAGEAGCPGRMSHEVPSAPGTGWCSPGNS